MLQQQHHCVHIDLIKMNIKVYECLKILFANAFVRQIQAKIGIRPSDQDCMAHLLNFFFVY